MLSEKPRVTEFQTYHKDSGEKGKVVPGFSYGFHGPITIIGGRSLQAADIVPEDGGPAVTVYLEVPK